MSLTVASVSVSYGSTEVLEPISLTLTGGTVTALIGPNGTGKSSLLKAVAGLIPAAGHVHFGERRNLSARGRNEVVAYMPQDGGVTSSLTVLEVVVLGRLRSLGLRVGPRLLEEAAGVLRQFGVDDLQTRTLEELSGGQRQLVYLAQTLFRDPPVLMLDEPTAALDLNHQLTVLEAVRNHALARSLVTVMALHDLSLAARFADRIVCLSGGRVVADGTPEQVLDTGLIREVYGVESEISRSRDGAMVVTPLRALPAPAA